MPAELHSLVATLGNVPSGVERGEYRTQVTLRMLDRAGAAEPAGDRFVMMAAMPLSLGLDRQTGESRCDDCDTPIQHSWGTINADGRPYVAYFANCYHHRDQDHDAWIDVIFGAFDGGENVSFGCRVGPVYDHDPTPAASLVTAGLAAADDEPLFGRRLDREAALQHPRLSDFWQVTDFVLEHDRQVRWHLYGW